jgi:hypothetical protein
VLGDAGLQAEAARAKNEINAVDGDEIQAMLAAIGSAPASVIDLLKNAMTYKGEELPTGATQPK